MDMAELMKKAVNCEMIEMKSRHVCLDEGRQAGSCSHRLG